MDERYVGPDIHGNTNVFCFWYPLYYVCLQCPGCLYRHSLLWWEIPIQNPVSALVVLKRGNKLWISLRDDATSWHSCSQWTGWWGRRKRQKLINSMFSCKKMGQGILGNMQVFPGPYIPEPGWGHGVASPWEQEWCHHADRIHQDWRRGDFIDLDR